MQYLGTVQPEFECYSKRLKSCPRFRRFIKFAFGLGKIDSFPLFGMILDRHR